MDCFEIETTHFPAQQANTSTSSPFSDSKPPRTPIPYSTRTSRSYNPEKAKGSELQNHGGEEKLPYNNTFLYVSSTCSNDAPSHRPPRSGLSTNHSRQPRAPGDSFSHHHLQPNRERSPAHGGDQRIQYLPPRKHYCSRCTHEPNYCRDQHDHFNATQAALMDCWQQ